MNQSSFVDRYRECLRRHLGDEPEAGYGDAADLGRAAFNSGMSLFELVEAQGQARRQIAPSTAVHLDVCDRFFTAALAAFEVIQRANLDAQQERSRRELLQRLTQAYLAVAAGKTADGRCEAAARQIELLLAAPAARVELVIHSVTTVDADASVLSAPLPGGAGRIVVAGAPGRVWTEAEEAVLHQLAVLIHSPIVEARLLELSERLERVGALLGEENDPQSIVDRMAADGIEQTGAAFGVILLPDGGRLTVVGARSSGRWAVGDVAPTDDNSPIAVAVRTGRPLFLPDRAAIARWSHDHGVAVPDPSGEAWAIVPLPAGGALGLRFERPQSFDPAQQTFLTALGDRLAAALDRGRTFTAEREARRDAEAAAERVSQLHQLAAELTPAATRRAVAATLLDHAVRMTGAAGGLVAAPADEPDAAVLGIVGPQGRGNGVEWDGVARLLATGAVRPERFDVASLPSPAIDMLRAQGARTIAVHALTGRSRSVGRLVLWWSDGALATFDRRQLEAGLAIAGPAMWRAGRYDVEHDISLTLQRSLLTVAQVEIPGVEWSARYRSGSRGVAGGDWYDVIALGDGRVGVAIGDIVGKGVEAAAAMGQLRSATRALARRIDDPAELLAALDDYTASNGPGRYSSAAYMVIDPGSGAVEHAIAGHPPPVVRSARHGTLAIETGRGPLLGIEGARVTASMKLELGDLLVLYTDGLVERRRRSLDDGLERLREAVQAGSTVPAQLSQQVIDACHDGGASDDIAIVVVKLVGP